MLARRAWTHSRTLVGGWLAALLTQYKQLFTPPSRKYACFHESHDDDDDVDPQLAPSPPIHTKT